MRRDLFIPLLAVAALGVGAPSFAAEKPDTVSVHVRVADLDLNSPAGARAALARVRRAASAVCGGEPDMRDLAAHSAWQGCVHAAVNATVAHSRSPMLAALNGTPLSEDVLAAN
jgi:UrcA family protein